MLRRILCTALALSVLLAGAVCAGALVQPELMLDSESAIVMCAETGQVLYAKNPDKVLYPASITKILTAMVALQNAAMDDVITFSQTAYKSVPRDSAHIALSPGETLTMQDALYALALVSANDAAAGIAETVGGSIAGFAELMNAQAEKCGAVNSHFTNPHGLPDENHYTTARDMALITKAALETPGFPEIFSTLDYTMAPTNKKEEMPLTSKNRFTDGLLDCPGFLFSKTGWTVAAQGTLVTAARREGVTLIAVVMKSPKLEQKYADTQALLDYAYGSFLPHNLTADEASALLWAQGMPETLRCRYFDYFPVLIPVQAKEGKCTITPLADMASGGALPVLIGVHAEGEESFLMETEVFLEENPEPMVQPEPTSEPTVAFAPSDDAPADTLRTLLLCAIGFVSCYLIGLTVFVSTRRRRGKRERRRR